MDVYPTKWPHLQDIKFPEKFPRNEQEIDVLIGLDFYYSFVSRDVVRGGPNEPVALRTSLGWVFSGPTGSHGQDCTVSVIVQVCASQELNDTLQKFWNLESIGIKPVEMPVSTSQSESTVLKKFKATLAYKNGRYEVSLPWKDEQVVLKDNYKQGRSTCRLYNLEKNLLQDSSKAKSYQEAINKNVEDRVAEEVP